MNLIENLIDEGWLKTPEIIEAFKKIKRVDFLPKDMVDLAEVNEALPIGWGQTISQPLVVAFMLELLSPKRGEKVLDVGAGSGWTTALLAHCVSQQGNSKFQITNNKQITNSKSKIQNGKVIAMEIIPELKEFGERNVAKYNFIEKGIVEFICADGSKGFNKEAPYDKILASAAVHPHTRTSFGVGAREIPEAWKEQLKVGGKIVAPINSSIWLFEKKEDKEFKSKEFPGFAFVPLV